MKKPVAAKKLISEAYEDYEVKREELSAFLADQKRATVINDYLSLRADLDAALERVKKVYAAHHEALGIAYKDFTCTYAMSVDAKRLIQLLGDDADIYIDHVPQVNRDAYDAGVRAGHIPASVARQVETRSPRIYKPKA
jgi:hypothetical protein